MYGPVNILHLQGTYGATSQLLRTKALEDAVEQNDNWNFVAQLEGDYTEAKAYEIIRDKNSFIDEKYKYYKGNFLK